MQKMMCRVLPLIMLAGLCQAQVAPSDPIMSVIEPEEVGTSRVMSSRRGWTDFGFGAMLPHEPLWGDLRTGDGRVRASWVKVPLFMMMYHTKIPSTRIAAGTRVQWNCPRYNMWWNPYKSCECFVLTYRCKTCEFEDGGLIPFLLSQGFEEFPCAPTFKVWENGVEHPMISLRRVAMENERIEIVLPETTSYTVFASSYSNWECEGLSEMYCSSPQKAGLCKWENGQCQHSRSCVNGPDAIMDATAAELQSTVRKEPADDGTTGIRAFLDIDSEMNEKPTGPFAPPPPKCAARCILDDLSP